MRMKRDCTIDTQDLDRPPCWPKGTQCPNPCAAALHERVTQNHVHLTGPWRGWRMAGRDLVSPTGLRITARAVEGLAWRQAAETRLADARARNKQRAVRRGIVTVLRVQSEDWHRQAFGTIAG